MHIEQNINTVDGFAYGVIGADLHVFGDGVPVYLLAQHRPTPAAAPQWLRELPSRMLNARHEVVEFTGRDTELADLHNWRQQGPRLAARWLHGPGGQGKTRLAARFADESAAAGWKVIDAIHGPGTILAANQPSQDLRLDGYPGVLLIIDYADRWPLSHLTWLLSNRILHQLVPTRILMLARSDDGWPAVRASLSNHQASTSGQQLQPLRDGHDERTAMFNAARDGFANRYQIAGADSIQPPMSLDHPDMGLILAIHMAALVAVDAQAANRDLPLMGTEALTIYLLDREHLHWERMYGDGTHELNAAVRTFHTPPSIMNQTCFTAALTGVQPPEAGADIVRRLGLGDDVHQTLDDHRACYPSTSSDCFAVLEPLYPDRLAEDFLALTLPGHTADYPTKQWAPDINARLLTSQGDPLAALWLSRAVTFLASAASRWRHVRTSHLYPLLRNHPHVLIDAGSAAITTFTAIGEIDQDVLEAVYPLLPTGRNFDLDVGAASISHRLTTYRLAATPDSAERAKLLYKHAVRLANAGRHAEATLALEEAANRYRPLAQVDSAAHLPSLGQTLINLAASLSELGRPREAQHVADEAVGIYRRLTEMDPAGYRHELGKSLNNLGMSLSKLGQHQEALSATLEAADLCRQLAETDPATHLLDLAVSLNNLAAIYVNLGSRDQAVNPAGEAVTVCRQLVEAAPVAHIPDLSRSLNTLGVVLSEVGQYTAALSPTREATDLYRRLADVNPTAYVPDLAMALTNLATRTSDLGLRDEAHSCVAEAVGLYRKLAEANPAAYLPTLAAALTSLSLRMSEMGLGVEALGPAEEAVVIDRRLAEANPDVYLPDLAMSLTNLSNSLSDRGRREDAFAVGQEAAETYGRLADAHPAAYLPYLAVAQVNLGNHLAGLGQQHLALAATSKAVSLLRGLAAANPKAYLPKLATSLNNLSGLMSKTDAPEALVHAEEAWSIRRQLSDTDPVAHLPDLATSLNTLSNRLAELRLHHEALIKAEEATALWRQLVHANRAAHLPDLAQSLNNLGVLLSQMDRHEDALAVTEEAVRLYQDLANNHPAAHLPTFALMLRNLGGRLAELGRPEEAVARVNAAVVLHRQLADADPATFLPDLADSLSNLGIRLAEQGRNEQAIGPSEEAVAIRRRLVATSPSSDLSELARELFGLGWVLAKHGGDLLSALAAIEEAVGIYERLGGHEGHLTEAYDLQAKILIYGLGRHAEARRVRRKMRNLRRTDG